MREPADGSISPIGAAEASRPPVSPRRRPLLGRVLLWLLGVAILSVAVLLPYRARIAFSDALGRTMNACYHAFVRLVRWFLDKLRA
jgi:hypothetical protein